MTMLVARLDFLPKVLNTDTGSEVQRLLVPQVSGGIVFSTILNLLLSPTLYRVVRSGKLPVAEAWLFARTALNSSLQV